MSGYDPISAAIRLCARLNVAGFPARSGGMVISLSTRFEAPVNDCDRNTDIEVLARMAARLAGRDPDEHLRMELAEVVAFDDVLWRYPDFLDRAEAAYEMLHCYPFVQSDQPAEQSVSAL